MIFAGCERVVRLVLLGVARTRRRWTGRRPVRGRPVHLRAGEEECADAFRVLVDDGLFQVVGEVAGAVGRAAEAADLDRAVEGERAVGVGGDEALLDAVPGAPGGGVVGLRKVAQADALGERVGEHAARGGFEIVAVIGFRDAEADAAVGLLLHHRAALRGSGHDLPPEAGFGVLHLEDGGHDAVERGDQRGALRMVGGEPVEHVDQGHAVPALRSAPDLGAEAGGLVGPGHLLGLVPAVAEEAGLGVAHVLVHEQELFGDVVEVLRLLEGCSVCGAEGLGHVGAVEPHLVGVDLLVPVASAGGARLLRRAGRGGIWRPWRTCPAG